MRKAAFALLLAFVLAACKSNQTKARRTIEGDPLMASSVAVADAKAASQLVSGFHGVEDNAWRWTQRQFSIALATPAGAARKGGVLSLRLTVPPVVIEKLKTVGLSASIDGSGLAPETFGKPGSYTYRREVPVAHLAGEKVVVNFELDKALRPGGADIRELGIIVLGAALESK